MPIGLLTHTLNVWERINICKYHTYTGYTCIALQVHLSLNYRTPQTLSLRDKRRCDGSLSSSLTRHLTYLDELVQSLLIRLRSTALAVACLWLCVCTAAFPDALCVHVRYQMPAIKSCAGLLHFLWVGDGVRTAGGSHWAAECI